MLTFLFIFNTFIYAGPLEDAIIELSQRFASPVLIATDNMTNSEALLTRMREIEVLCREGVNLTDFLSAQAYLLENLTNSSDDPWLGPARNGLLDYFAAPDSDIRIILTEVEETLVTEHLNDFMGIDIYNNDAKIFELLQSVEGDLNKLLSQKMNSDSFRFVDLERPTIKIRDIISYLLSQEFDGVITSNGNAMKIIEYLAEIMPKFYITNNSAYFINKSDIFDNFFGDLVKKIEEEIKMTRIYRASVFLNKLPTQFLQETTNGTPLNKTNFFLFIKKLQENPYFNVNQYKGFLFSDNAFPLLFPEELNEILASSTEYRRNELMRLKLTFGKTTDVIKALIKIGQPEIAGILLDKLGHYNKFGNIKDLKESINNFIPYKGAPRVTSFTPKVMPLKGARVVLPKTLKAGGVKTFLR